MDIPRLRPQALPGLLVCLMLILAACGPTTTPTPAPTSAPATAAATEAAPTETTNTEAAPTDAPAATAETATEDPGAAEPVTLIIARTASRTINPVGESNIEGAQNIDLVYESLVQMDGEGNILPSLATAWEPSEDFQTWTFHLREGVNFHDGTPFNAEAVKYNYDRLLRVPGQSGGAWTSYADENTVEVVDDYTVIFQLTAPFPTLPMDMLYIRYSIVSPTWLQANATTADPEAMEFSATNASGTGPFRLVEFVPDQRTVFERNPDYWGGEPGGKATPQVDQVIFQIIRDPEAARVELEAGRVDIVEGPPPLQFEGLRNTPGIALTGFKVPRIAYLTMDVSKPPFDDVKLRQAVAHAINYDELMQAGELGFAFPQCGMVPEGLTVIVPPDPALCLYPYDPDMARQLLSESAYPDGVTIDLTYAPDRNAGFEVEAQLLQSYLAEVGITANVQALDVVAQVAKMAEGAYGLSLFVWNAGIPDADDFPGWLYDQGRLPTNESWVGSFWNDEAVMQAMRDARGSTDPAERQALYEAANLQAMQEAIYIPLFQGSKVFAYQDNIEGLNYTVFRRLNIWDIVKN